MELAKKQTSRLTEIYLAQKAKGGGLGSALVERAKEKFDPRQTFSQSGLLAAMLPSLFKAYKSPTRAMAKKPSPMIERESSFSPSLEGKVDLLVEESRAVKINTKMMAKNSLVMPMMARDLNLIRQNVQKITKIQGASAATKSDMFFKRSAEREKEYEEKKEKELAYGVGKKLPFAKDSKEKGSGVLGLLGGAFGEIEAIS